MTKKSLLLAALFMMTASLSYAKPGHGPESMGKPGMHEMGPGQGMQEDRGMLIKMAGLESIAEKYKIQIQRIMLDSKEANLQYNEQKRELHKAIHDLVPAYDANPDKTGAEIAKKLEQLNQIEIKMGEIRQKAMDQIHKLHQQEQKELRKGIDEWVSTLSKDSKEMKKFVDHVKKMEAMKSDKGPK